MNLASEYAAAPTPVVKRKVVRAHVMAYLANLTGTIHTDALAQNLWPVQGADHATRKAFIDDLLRLARTELNGVCAKKGPPDPHRKFMGKPLTPWLWHRPCENVASDNCKVTIAIIDTGKQREKVLEILSLAGNGFSFEDCANEIMKVFQP